MTADTPELKPCRMCKGTGLIHPYGYKSKQRATIPCHHCGGGADLVTPGDAKALGWGDVQIKEYIGAGSDLVMITNGLFSIECVPRKLAPTILAALRSDAPAVGDEWFFRWAARAKGGYCTPEHAIDVIFNMPGNPYEKNNPWEQRTLQSRAEAQGEGHDT